ncbi:MAG TPA: amidohydrolase family protein [Streptosporangiaceae bacterium]
MASTGARTAVTNVRVFDGRQLLPPATVVIEGARIGSDPAGARMIDGEGGVLLPGLIDAHVHLHGRHTLEQLARFGVTTALDMACAPPELVNSLRGAHGLTDIRSAGTPAIAPGSPHSHIPVIGQRGLISGAPQARPFVAERVAEGSDYIKIVVGTPAPSHDQATLDALAEAAREHGKLSVAHASSCAAVAMAQRARVSVLTHVPLDKALDQAAADRAVADGTVVIPTLAMMEGIVRQSAPPGRDYAAARASVTVLYQAGVPILAGTDANAEAGGPAVISHGSSLHHELELLVDAGLTTVDALRAATSRPARYFGLGDRGVVEPGRRADLLLIDADPLRDIKATQAIRRVWCGGTPVRLEGITP